MKKESKPILVVEDDVDLCNSILATLHREGFAPAGVVDVREAMFKLKNQKYSCILLDMRLGPDSGEEIISFTRTRADIPNKDTPIIVISGHLDRSVVEKIAPSIQGALVKPFDMKALLEMVRKHAK